VQQLWRRRREKRKASEGNKGTELQREATETDWWWQNENGLRLVSPFGSK